MIYTDKLPENCINCPCQDGEYGQCNITLNECNADKRPQTCPLILIEQWRLESCHTCNGKACQAFTSHEFTGATCEDWQPK